MLQVCLYAPRKCDKFPKVIINALIILHWLHCIPNPFSALLLQLGGGGGRGNNKPSAYRSWLRLPSWVLEMEVIGRNLKQREESGNFPSLPACLPQSHSSHGPSPQSQLSALVISGELRASQSYYSLGASPSLVCSLTSILSSFWDIKDEISFPAGALPDLANNTKSGYSNTVHYLMKSNVRVL